MSADSSAAIEVVGLRKRYGDNEAVAGVDLTVAAGEVLAFLGPNGAGKTTTVEILEGLRTRTAGEVRVLGVDPADATAAWRERIGVVLQDAKHEGDFTAQEVVKMWSAYYRSPRSSAEVLELVGLADAAKTRTRRLSGGQQQRLAVALALVGRPELVFLDEPTTGFDPAARREAWVMIDGLRSLGVTVLLTTHYMDEADCLADRIAVILRGRIVARGTGPELAAEAAMPTLVSWDTAALAPDRLPDRLRSLLRVGDTRAPESSPAPASGVSDGAGSQRAPLAVDEAVDGLSAPVYATGVETPAAVAAAHSSRSVIATRDVDAVVRGLLDAADVARTRLDSLAVQPPTLEDTYLALTGTDAGDAHDAHDAHDESYPASTRPGAYRSRSGRAGRSDRRPKRRGIDS